MSRVAAIDYGRKRLGLALSDPSRTLALPVAVVEGGKKALQKIRAFLPLKEIDLILIGYPITMKGEESELSQEAKNFAQMIEDAFHIPILLVDERLTSRHAEVKLKELPLSRKKRSEKLDMIAASLFLQTYLDQQKAI